MKIAAKKARAANTGKAKQKWKGTLHRARALAQPEGGKRAKPGTKGEGDYFRVIVRPKEQFVTFRNHDVGEKGHIQRLAGKRKSGSWDTQAWLIGKEDAHLEGDLLVPDTDDARDLLEKLGSNPIRIKGDIFEAQKRAQRENIRKARAVRREKIKEEESYGPGAEYIPI